MQVPKRTVHSEAIYFLSLLMLALSVAMTAAADFGVSMVVAPAYIMSLKTGLTFGQCEYILQGGLFILFCLLMKGVRAVYFCAFLSSVFYGAALDLWRLLIPAFNPAVTAPGSMALPWRIALLVAGVPLASLAIAMCFRSYLYPQVNDFFVKGVSWRYGIDRTKFKIGFDASCLALSVVMTLLFFKSIRGIGVGTLLMTALNGLLIGRWGALLDRCFTVTPWLPGLAAHFALKGAETPGEGGDAA